MARTCRISSDTALVVLGGGLLVLWGMHSWASTSGAAGPGGPSAVLASTRRDLGALVQGPVLRVTFPIRNTGDRRLVVRQVTASCCGQPAAKSTIVMPGGSAILDLEIDTNRWSGEMHESVEFATNDSSLPEFTLRVEGRVRAGD